MKPNPPDTFVVGPGSISQAISIATAKDVQSRLTEAQKELNAVDSSIEKLRFDSETPDEDVIAQLPALVNESYALYGEIKGLKRALGLK